MELNNKSYNIILAAGGTGGHLFPAVAIADAIKEISPESRFLFIASGKELEKKIIDSAGYSMETISISGIAGLGVFTKMKAASKIPGAVFKSAAIIKGFEADAVIGMGSYTAGPVLLAAKMLGIPTAIHEQNRHPGITNRIMSKYVGRIYSSFEDTFQHEKSEKQRYLGNPVRSDIVQFSKNCTNINSNNNDSFKILVLGGSQGARSINKTVTASLPFFSNPGNIEFIHQTGSNDYEDVKAEYEKAGIKSEVRPFFDDMAKIYSEADLLICRAGASTVAEIAVMGKPSIFIPFPSAAGDHQSQNAEALENAGAAIIIEERDLTPEILASRITCLKESPEALKEMSLVSKSFGRPDAAKEIANDIISWIESKI